MTRRQWWAFAWVAALMIGASGCDERNTGHDVYELMEGQGIYKAECAACHGSKLEGQANWQTRRPDGKLPAPPHDMTGHTWHHPRDQLAAIVKFGMVPPHAPADYVSDMPAFGGKLSDAQIDNVLAWIESQWPQEILKQRAEMLKQR